MNEWSQHLNKYRKDTGWNKTNESVSFRSGDFVEPDGKLAPEEDFANNVEYFVFEPQKLNLASLQISKWIEKTLKSKLQMERGCDESAASKNKIWLLALCMFTTSCASMQKDNLSAEERKFENVTLGETTKQIEASWGHAAREKEIYPSAQLESLSYYKADGRPYAFFTIDPRTQQIIGKSLWIDSSSNYKLSTLLETRLKGIILKKYTPCRTRSSSDQILVNQKQGIYITTSKDHVSLTSWSVPELVELRIKLLESKCPGLQK